MCAKYFCNASSLTIVVPVQTFKCQPQFLLVLFQVFGELFEVETPIFVLVTRRHNLLQRRDKTYILFICLLK